LVCNFHVNIQAPHELDGEDRLVIITLD
jgi:hypothetical protein